MQRVGRVTTDIIEWYESRGLRLTPLADSEPHRGKRPLLTDWVSRQVDPVELRDYAARGYNLGWVLSGAYAVLDVDPRNNGAIGLSRITDVMRGENPSKTFPTVNTGSGGYHYYGAVPVDIETTKNSELFPGVDLQRSGTQVVVPGSYHYTSSDYYSFDLLSPTDLSDFPLLPFDVVDAFTRSAPRSGASAPPSPGLTSDELSNLLNQIDVTQYRSNDSWFTLLCAAHHATRGEGCDAFVRWSTSDPRYAGHDAVIRYRWRSLRGDKRSLVTYKSLIDALYKNGGSVPPAIRAKIDFVEVPDLITIGAETPEQAASFRRDRARNASLEGRIRLLTHDSGSAEIDSVLQLIADATPLDQSHALKQIANQTGRDLATLRRLAQQYRNAQLVNRAVQNDQSDRVIDFGRVLSGDFAYAVALAVIDKHFRGGRTLCVGPDEDLWCFDQTHWRPISRATVSQLILKEIETYVDENPGVPVAANSVRRQALELLPAMVSQHADLLSHSPNNPYTVINTLSDEIWVHNTHGDITVMQHAPESLQTNVLPIQYDGAADCPLFEKTLRQIFSPVPDSPEVVRHLIELFGYTMQARKDLPVWVLFYGFGANGKSLLLSVLAELLGERALACPINDLDPNSSAHSTAMLPGKFAVIDDDFETGSVLSDNALKRISENKLLQANPKYKHPYSFTNTAICYIAANTLPSTRDFSFGVRRRANVFRFLRNFARDGDPDLIYKLRGELPGIFNWCLTGLYNLRRRGRFILPTSVAHNNDEWFVSASQIQRFLRSASIHSHRTTLSDLWDAYRAWVYDEGLKRTYSRSMFCNALETQGLERCAGYPVTFDTTNYISSGAFIIARLEHKDKWPCSIVEVQQLVNDYCVKTQRPPYTKKAIAALSARLGDK